MDCLGENKANSIMSDVWPNHYYSNKDDCIRLLLKRLEIHIMDLNNQINELTIENIRLSNK